jgi:LPXTG-motif cell wall-anchored protein
MIALPASTAYAPACYITPGGHALKSTTRLRRYRQLRAAIAMAGGIAMAGIAVPAAAAPADLPDLQVSASFDKATYGAGDPVTITIIIKNAGKATALNVAQSGGYQNGFDLGNDSGSGTPFDLAPGTNKTLTRHGVINALGSSVGFIDLAWGFDGTNGDAKPADNLGQARASVPGAKRDVLISVHRTTDGNFTVGQPGLAAVKVRLVRTDDPTKAYAEATTDTAGNVLFHQVAVGEYHVHFVAPDGWKDPSGSYEMWVRSGEGVENGLEVGAVPVPTTGGPSASTSGSPSASPTPSSTGTAGGLPVTGTNVAVFVSAGTALVMLGGVAYLVGRRRRA